MLKSPLSHVDVNYSDLYTGLIDVNLGDMQKRISEETHRALTELSTNAGYPITETLSGSGDHQVRFWLMPSKNTTWIWSSVVTTRISGAN